MTYHLDAELTGLDALEALSSPGALRALVAQTLSVHGLEHRQGQTVRNS
jgi:hypothetical protein